MLVRHTAQGNATSVHNFLEQAQHALWAEASKRGSEDDALGGIFRADSMFWTTIRNTTYKSKSVDWFETACPTSLVSSDGKTAMLRVYHDVHAWSWLEHLLLSVAADNAGVSATVTGA